MRWRLAALGVAYVLYSWWTFPSGGLTFFVCPFRWATGLRCPLCGLTHSLGAILTGDIGMAFHYHPAGPLLLVTAAAWLTYTAWAELYRSTAHRQ